MGDLQEYAELEEKRVETGGQTHPRPERFIFDVGEAVALFGIGQSL